MPSKFFQKTKSYVFCATCFVALLMLFFATPVAKADCTTDYDNCLQQQCKDVGLVDEFNVPTTQCNNFCRNQQTECENPGYETGVLNIDFTKDSTKKEENKTPMERLNIIGGEEGAGLTKLENDMDFKTAGQIFPQYLGLIVNAALSLLGVVFFALMVYGGFLWLYAGGNDEQVTKAKTIITRAFIGFMIVILAGGITQFVIYYVGR